MIIGIAGRALHGKDTIGKVLVEHYGYQRIAFADKVRELALAINPPLGHSYYGSRVVEPLATIVNRHGWDNAKKIPQVREFLQNLGEGARQVLGEWVWISPLFSIMDFWDDNYVITDVRYQNQVTAIRTNGGKVWRVTRQNFDNGVDPDHPSEANVALLDVDMDVRDGSIVDCLRTFESDKVLAAKTIYDGWLGENGGDFPS